MVLRARNEATGVMSKFRSEMTGGWKSVALGAGVAGAAAAATAAVVADKCVRSYAGFQDAVTAAGNAEDLTVKQTNALSDSIINVGNIGQYSSNDLMTGFAPVAGLMRKVQGAVLSTKQTIDFMRSSANLATSTNSALTNTEQDLGTVMLATNAKIADSAKVSNVLNTTSKMTSISIDQLTNGINRMRPYIAGTGIGISQLGGLMMETVEKFGTGRKAIMGVGTFLQHLTEPTSTTSTLMTELGVKTHDAAGHFLGLGTVLNQFRGFMHENLTEMQKQTLAFEVYGKTGAAAHVNDSVALLKEAAAQKVFGSSVQMANFWIDQGKSGLTKYEQEVTHGATASKDAAKQNATMAGQMRVLHATISGAATAIGSALAPAIEKLAKWVVPIIKDIARWTEHHKTLSAIILASTFVIGTLIALVVALSFAFAALDTAALPWIAAAIAIVAATTLIVMYWKQVKDFLKKYWPEIAIAATGGMDLLLVLMIKYWKQIEDVIRHSVGWISQMLETGWARMREKVEYFWGLIVNTLTMFWNKIMDAANSWGQAIAGYFTGLWGDLTAGASAIWDDIKSAWDAVWNAIVGVLQAVWNALKTAASTVWGWLTTAAKAVWDGLQTAWSATWNAIQTAVTTIWDAIKTAASTVWGWLTTAAGDVWDGITIAWSTSWKATKEAVTTIWDAIKTAASTVWGWLTTAAGDVWDGIKIAWSATWKAIKTAVSKVWDDIKTDASTVWGGLTTAAKTVWDGVEKAWSTSWKAIKVVWQTAAKWLKDIPGMIGQYFKGAKTWLKNAGEDVIQGLWDGMKSIWSKVESWFSSSVGWLAKEAGKVLKSGSPSEVFKDLGTGIMQGLQLGIQGSAGLPLSAINSATSALTSPVSLGVGSGGVSLGGSSGANSSSITFNITGNMLTDGPAIDLLTNKIGAKLATFGLPASGNALRH